jgi:hypothetical protein
MDGACGKKGGGGHAPGGFGVLPQAYKGKLYDEKVYGFFKEIMKKLSSFMKAEIKQEAEDLKVRVATLRCPAVTS